MEGIHVSLSDNEQAFVEAEAARGGYASASDYVASLIQSEVRSKGVELRDALLLRALDEQALRREAAGD